MSLADSPDTETGFLDVAANALAVVILATMMVLVVAAPPREPGEIRSEAPAPELAFATAHDTRVAPLSAYLVVTQAGVTTLDLDAFAARVASGSRDLSTPQGTMSFIAPRTARRDYDEYRASIRLDMVALRAGARPAEDADALAEELAVAHEVSREVPTFLVSAEAAGTFAPVYWALREAGVPLRWFWLSPGAPLVLERKPTVFDTRSRTWR